MIKKGGLEFFQNFSQQKSELLYDAIDSSKIYSNQVKKKYRSRMNVPFECKKEEWNELFLTKAG